MQDLCHQPYAKGYHLALNPRGFRLQGLGDKAAQGSEPFVFRYAHIQKLGSQVKINWAIFMPPDE